MGNARIRVRRRLVIAASAAAFVVAPMPARADITGPCTGTLAGEDVRNAHGDAGSAIKIPYDATASVTGRVAGRARAVRYSIELAGIKRDVPVTIQAGQKSSSWSGTAEIKKYAWASVGLFKVVGAASTTAGRCSGVVYVCITGKSPVTTAAGGTGTAALIGGLVLLAVSIAKAKGRSAGESAIKAFFPAAIGGAGAVLLLQQSCVMPLEDAALILPVAAGIGGSVLAPVVGGILGNKPPAGGYAPALPSSAPPPSDIPPEATHVSLQGPSAINTLIAAGATQVPGTMYVRPPDKDLPGILGTSFTTTKIPDPANPGQTIDVIDPSAVIVLAQPGNVPAPAPEPLLTPPPPPPPAGPTTTAPPSTTSTTPPAPGTTEYAQTPAPQPSVVPPAPAAPPGTEEKKVPPPPPSVAADAAQPPPKEPEHPLIKTLLQPGGGSVTIPPGSSAPLIPTKYLSGEGNLMVPDNVPMPSLAKWVLNNEPPPVIEIQKDKSILIRPGGALTGFVAAVSQTQARVRISYNEETGTFSSVGTLKTLKGPADLKPHIDRALNALAKRIKESGLKISEFSIDSEGIHLTTVPQ